MYQARLNVCILAILSLCSANLAQAEGAPNILEIWGDDVGIGNISAYSFGLLGYQTPNIDRLAKEGMLFTDYYAEPASLAARASYITGQSVYRTGLFGGGKPGADRGMQAGDPTIAALLKEHGYATGQFGKNHLGDKDAHLPTNHGFDAFFGILYDLNAGASAEQQVDAKDTALPRKYARRGVIKSSADGQIEDTGPLSEIRMQTIDDETLAAAISFIERARASDTPFYVWWNAAHLPFDAPLGGETHGAAGQNDAYAERFVEHDIRVGQLLELIDRLGIADNTIVHYSTDAGPTVNSRPGAAVTPFRNETSSNWEGGWRVPSLLRWPGKIAAGAVSNEIMHHMDWLPTYLAAAGSDDIKERLLKGNVRAIGRRYKVHLDGYDFLPYLTGEAASAPRREVFYFSADGALTALRYGDWKGMFMEHVETTAQTLAQPYVPLRAPLLFNLRRDPYERAQLMSDTQHDWLPDNATFFVPAEESVGAFRATLRKFPPRQKNATFSLDQVLQQLQNAGEPREPMASDDR